MLIFHHGHSEFLLELADGYRILTDPFDAHVATHAPGTLRRGDGQPRARRSQRGEQGRKITPRWWIMPHHRAGSRRGGQGH